MPACAKTHPLCNTQETSAAVIQAALRAALSHESRICFHSLKRSPKAPAEQDAAHPHPFPIVVCGTCPLLRSYNTNSLPKHSTERNGFFVPIKRSAARRTGGTHERNEAMPVRKRHARMLLVSMRIRANTNSALPTARAHLICFPQRSRRADRFGSIPFLAVVLCIRGVSPYLPEILRNTGTLRKEKGALLRP